MPIVGYVNSLLVMRLSRQKLVYEVLIILYALTPSRRFE